MFPIALGVSAEMICPSPDCEAEGGDQLTAAELKQVSNPGLWAARCGAASPPVKAMIGLSFVSAARPNREEAVSRGSRLCEGAGAC